MALGIGARYLSDEEWPGETQLVELRNMRVLFEEVAVEAQTIQMRSDTSTSRTRRHRTGG
jgi:hypothetical protein